MSNRWLWLIVLTAFGAGVGAGWFLRNEHRYVEVEVIGRNVAEPGVYRLPADARVCDAIRTAGGLVRYGRALSSAHTYMWMLVHSQWRVAAPLSPIGDAELISVDIRGEPSYYSIELTPENLSGDGAYLREMGLVDEWPAPTVEPPTIKPPSLWNE